MRGNRQNLALAGSNPFATRFIRAGALPFRFQHDESIGDVHTRLRRHQWRGQIVGPHGSGKTTLLRTLDGFWPLWNREPVTFTLRDGQRCLPSHYREPGWHHRTQVIVDGYEQLGWHARALLRFRCHQARCGLLVTTHRPVILATVLKTNTNLSLARDLVGELLANDSSGKPTRDDIEACFTKTGGNLRETFLALYDMYR